MATVRRETLPHSVDPFREVWLQNHSQNRLNLTNSVMNDGAILKSAAHFCVFATEFSDAAFNAFTLNTALRC
jgi:hypothetical protein